MINEWIKFRKQSIEFVESHPKYQYDFPFKGKNQVPATVLASFSLINTRAGNEEEPKTVSVGFGTKSLPYSLAKECKGMVIKDMHAEILARNGLIRFLAENIPPYGEQNQYFEWDHKRYKHRLQVHLRLVFYSSQVFCGDCSIEKQADMFSGAKPLEFFAQQHIPHNKYTKYCLRTKPGRMDLPIHKKSLSLSCSDKIGVWNILGVQGKRLFRYLLPIYISDIVMENKSNVSKSTISKGINMLHRIQSLKGYSENSIVNRLFFLSIDGKIKRITNQFHVNEPNLHILKPQSCQTEEPRDIDSKTLDLAGTVACNKIEWVNGRTGLPEGVNVKKININKLSYFCSQELERYMNANLQAKSQETNDMFKYEAVKERIRLLFGMWTTEFKEHRCNEDGKD